MDILKHVVGLVTVERLGWGAVIFVGWFFFVFAATKWLPGKIRQGVELRDGSRVTYNLNGWTFWWLVHVVLFAGTLIFDLSIAKLILYVPSIFIVGTVFSLGWSWILYKGGPPSGPGAWTFVKDFVMGTQLNPSWLGVDLKVFAYQPSLMGLAVLNVAFAYAQYEAIGRIATQMWLYQTFWWGYLATHYYWEENVISMWDVIAEKFGLMLVWGDLVYVPVLYSIGGWYVMGITEPMHPAVASGLCALYLMGLWIFRGSNMQKHHFKHDREALIWGKPAQTLGDRLLISGWWGIGRKLNYTGEICVYFSFILTSGFHSWVPYVLPGSLVILLVHRAWRDEQRCAEKYGDLWKEYCAKARFRMVPFLY
jgi:delta14-sterol reductase